LVIDEVGILDNSSAVAAGRIFWHEIIGFRISEISGQRFITIEVIDPKRFIDRCGFVMRFLNSAKHDFVGSPINISSNALQADLDELVRLLVAWLEYRKKTNEPELPPPSSTQIRANGSRSQSE
jgi:hypothetical protein